MLALFAKKQVCCLRVLFNALCEEFTKLLEATGLRKLFAASDLIQPLYSVCVDMEAQRWEVIFLVP